MQYILTEEEYQGLIARAEKAEKKALRISGPELQQLCTHIADTMPVHVDWRDDDKQGPWGCVITAELTHGHSGAWECDDCPVQKICPYPHKSWSK